jgi:hypothetical protein
MMETSSKLVATNVAAVGLTSIQLSYSTAEIQRALFFGPTQEFEPPGVTAGGVLLVVNGELCWLEEGDYPDPAVRLTPEANIFRSVR